MLSVVVQLLRLSAVRVLEARVPAFAQAAWTGIPNNMSVLFHTPSCGTPRLTIAPGEVITFYLIALALLFSKLAGLSTLKDVGSNRPWTDSQSCGPSILHVLGSSRSSKH